MIGEEDLDFYKTLFYSRYSLIDSDNIRQCENKFAKISSKLKFVIENPENSNNTLLEFTVPEKLGEWQEYTSTFTPTKDLNWCHIYIVNYTTVNEGNDFAIDNIYFGTVQNTDAIKILQTFTVDISTNPPTITSTNEKL